LVSEIRGQAHNEESGVIAGNIDVDQRNTYSASGNGTLVGTRSFAFENAGSFSGDITIRTASGATAANSMIELTPTITGSGVGSSLTSPSTNIDGMGGTLKIYDGNSTSTADLATITPKTAYAVHAGEYFKVADTFFGSTLPTVQSDSLFISWIIDKNASDNLVIGVGSVASASSLGLDGNNAKLIDSLMASSSEAGAIVQRYSSIGDIEKAAQQLRPEINNAAFQAAMGVTDRIFGLVEIHLAETHLASLTGKSGVATGEQPNGAGVWLQGFGFRGDQDKRKSVDGYTADAYGFAFGTDTLVGAGNLRVGGAFSYGQSNIDDKGVNNGNKTDIDSYQATLYGSLLLDGWYLNGTLGLGKHSYDSKRIALGGVINGSHDAWQYTAKVDAGWPLKVGSATITPVAALTCSRLDQDSYTESGVGALHINSSDTDSFRSGLGAKALLPLHEGAVNAGLEVRAIWNHEFADTAQDTTASFVGGGSSFTTSGVDPAHDSAYLGASLRLSGGDKDVQQSLLLSYDAEIKNQYLSHTALLQARFDF
jgi:outer membrane autotransporter protein